MAPRDAQGLGFAGRACPREIQVGLGRGLRRCLAAADHRRAVFDTKQRAAARVDQG
jgi:hypothetical protein